MRWLAISLLLHAGVLLWLLPERETAAPVMSRVEVALRADEPAPIDVDVLSGPGSSGGAKPGARDAARPRRTMSRDAWQDLAIREDRGGAGTGLGGEGAGRGRGIGFGEGGGLAPARAIPVPPAPVMPIVEPPSKARPAVLVWPTRDEEVEDESDLFVARITVDETGSVVGARMIKTRPGARGDDAANAIWRFRYSPALNDRGAPIASTFEQPFQVR